MLKMTADVLPGGDNSRRRSIALMLSKYLRLGRFLFTRNRHLRGSDDDCSALHRMNYLKYISSLAWRFNPVRLREFEAAGFQCRLCPNSVAQGYVLEAHHRTYKRPINSHAGG